MDKEIENSIDGYKYLVTMCVYFGSHKPSYEYGDANKEYNICVCDTRDKAISAIKDDIKNNINVNNTIMEIAEPYNITRLGGIVKWKDNNNDKWLWEYMICPIKYN